MFWSHLSERGVLSVSRWVSGPAWPEAVRLVLLEVEALRQEGIAEPRNHMVVLAAGQTANVMLFRKPVTPEQMALVGRIADDRGFGILWPVPLGRADVSALTHALAVGPDDMTRRGYDVSPPTDDRPFFFQTLNILSGSRMPPKWERSASRASRCCAGSCSSWADWFPARRAPVRRPRLAPARARRRPEHGLLRVPRLRLHVRRDSAAAEAHGLPRAPELLDDRGPGIDPRRRRPRLLARGADPGLPPAARRAPRSARRRGASFFCCCGSSAGPIGQSFPVRVTISVVALVLAGAMMGLPFPLGMAAFDDRDRSWFWAINGATSVLASVLALVIALIAGFTVVLGCAVVIYLIAAVTLPALRRPA